MSKLEYLLERDREEALRISTRSLDFPDGKTRQVEAYRAVWRWYDNLIAYEFAADALEILKYVLWTVEDRDIDAGEAFGLVVEYLVIGTEQRGGDITDDNLELEIANRQKAKWNARRKSG
ncbi:hypothetical protein [Roseibium algae]|uniref:Uncharacterized protein n=1 Tax=Roseibium algae TaxID=3123038 RepID=A0ABU8TFE1_9HYPH